MPQAATAMDPQRGELLAESAASRVYASRLPDGKAGVLKVSRGPLWDESLLWEARLSRELRHPALLPVLGHGIGDDGRAWLLFSRLSGRTLADWQGNEVELAELLTPVADALDLLHERGWVHGDLKPENLLLGVDDSLPPLLLSDLGLAVRQGEDSRGGSPLYLSPARLAGKPAAPRDDIHALAVLCFEALTGKAPWTGTDGDSLLASIARGRVHSLSRFRSDLPGEMGRLLARTLVGKEEESSCMDWMERLRAPLGLDPAPRALFLRPSVFPDNDLLADATRWLAVEPEVGSLLGRCLLLRQAGREERRLLESFLRRDLPSFSALEISPSAGRDEIARLESASPGTCPLLVGEREISPELEAYLLDRAQTRVWQWRGWDRDGLRAFLRGALHARGRGEVEPGSAELDFLLEAAGSSWEKLEAALNWMLDRQILRDESGRAVFSVEPSAWRDDFDRDCLNPVEGLSAAAGSVYGLLSRLQLALTEGEIELGSGLGTLALQAALADLRRAGLIRQDDSGGWVADGRPWILPDGGLPTPSFCDRIWQSSEGNEPARRRLLLAAASAGLSAWVGKLSCESLLSSLADASADQLRALQAHAGRLPSLLLDLKERRTDGLAAGFLDLEAQLDLDSAANLLRQVTTLLLEEDRIEEAFSVQEDWQDRRASEIAGKQVELRLAARELIARARFGRPAEASALAQEYQQRFRGRKCLWLLDWAKAAIAAEQGEYPVAYEFAARARSACGGDTSPRDRLSLSLYAADLGSLAGFAEEVSGILTEARNLAEKLNDPAGLLHSRNSQGLFLMARGDFQAAEAEFLAAEQSALAGGLWQDAHPARVNRAIALFHGGQYGRLLSPLSQLEHRCQRAERLLDILGDWNVLITIYLGLGSLDKAASAISAVLPIAEETGAAASVGLLGLKRGLLDWFRGEDEAAKANLDLAVARFQESGEEEEILHCRLQQILIDGQGGSPLELSGICEKLQARDLMRYLPLARLLHARSLRLAGEADTALTVSESAIVEFNSRPEQSWPLHAERALAFSALGRHDEKRRERQKAASILRDLSLLLPSGQAREAFLSRRDRRSFLSSLGEDPPAL